MQVSLFFDLGQILVKYFMKANFLVREKKVGALSLKQEMYDVCTAIK